ncbi:trypsin-like peptidase domain-containing protein [Steroidobacter sp. S1-65]|uniref:Trypsin-like peptidase domain-containing protein n=1 Tax=Steroidobacter gossypii TaxID=2805490 RepID=A0ABS1X1M8_9GAMM|nr:serine protease [Steroidobacter gossypii]MBM0107128.1 trypsin-like peptidase domain-containing protein [Steroidobacter gossypii]
MPALDSQLSENYKQLASPHMYKDLYTKLSAACGYITVWEAGERVSQGTGFCFRADGQIITAAHVVTGRFPIRESDYTGPDTKILVKLVGQATAEYRVGFCGLTIQVPGFQAPVQIDLALLIPRVPPERPLSFIPASTTPPQLGEEVFCAGYSDELDTAFGVERMLDRGASGAAEFLTAMTQGYAADMTGPLIKRAVVGNSRRVIAESTSTNIRIECDLIYVDNGMHSGASGGPVVNGQGDAVAVIAQRPMTTVSSKEYPGLRVPSGSTFALSLQPVEFICRRFG